MNPYALIDLHCDTLTGCGCYAPQPGTDSLNDPRKMLSLDGLPENVHWAQFFAIFIPDELRGQEAIGFFEKFHREFQQQTRNYSHKILPCRTWREISDAWDQHKTAGILAVENGSVLAGRLERVQTLADAGVRALTLTWNGENELGSGNATEHGLTPLGREAIPELDILYMTRVQRERFFNEADYLRLRDTYILDPEKLKAARADMCILHPLPRVNEITVDVDKDPRACYFRQAANGKFIRMALILKLLEVHA